MTPKLPRLSGKELVSALGRLGFQLIRIRGSHHFLKHADGRQTVVPVHAGETLGPGLLNKILHECEVSREDLSRVL
jgi:predicted RNA binding protein YcfA (HicA-like mRNA interferase family)